MNLNLPRAAGRGTAVFLSILILISAAQVLPAQEKNIENALAEMVVKVSRLYAEENAAFLKIPVAVGKIENNSETSRKLQMGNAARDMLISILSRSQIFTVVDRQNVNEILKEQKLQLSGLTEAANAVEIGSLINAKALLTGSITEQADSLLLSLQLIDLETGRVVSDTIEIEKTVFVNAAEDRLDLLYVSPMGIGISLTGISTTMSGNNATINPFAPLDLTYFRRTAGAELRYRPVKFLMLGIGADWLYGQVWTNPSVSWDMGGLPYPEPTGTSPFTITAEGLGIPVSIYGVLSPIRWLSLIAQISVEYYVLDFEGFFNPSNGFGFGVNDFGPLVHKEFLAISVLGGAEVFITPRFTFSLLAGYSYASASLDLPLWHLDLPQSLEIAISGFTLTPRLSVYF